jgi:hypothetical protein
MKRVCETRWKQALNKTTKNYNKKRTQIEFKINDKVFLNARNIISIKESWYTDTHTVRLTPSSVTLTLANSIRKDFSVESIALTLYCLTDKLAVLAMRLKCYNIKVSYIYWADQALSIPTSMTQNERYLTLIIRSERRAFWSFSDFDVLRRANTKKISKLVK